MSIEPNVNSTSSQMSEKQNFSERFQKVAEKNSPESWPEYFHRNVAQHGARFVETVAGFPGALKKAYNQTKDIINNNIFGDSESSFNKFEEQAFGLPEKGSTHEFIMNPYTPQEIREKITPIVAEREGGSKTYLEPRGKGEEIAGELTQDLTSFFMPGTAGLRMAVRLGAPIVGQLAKQGTKYLGGEESTAEKVKMGVMLATTLAGQSNPGEFAGQRIQQAKSMIPDSATIHVGNLANRLLPLYNRMMRGLGVPSKSRAIQGMQDLAGQVHNNRMSMRSLMDARDNVNEWISEAGGWDVPVSTRDATLRNLNELKSSIIETLNENMAARFPEAGELYRTGYEAAAVNHQSNAISNFIQRNFGRKTASIGSKILFPALAGGAAIVPKVGGMAAAAASAYPIYTTGKVLYRIANSPTLARYYQDVITYSMSGNAPAMIQSMDRLDKALKKDEENLEKEIKPTLEGFKQKFRKKG